MKRVLPLPWLLLALGLLQIAAAAVGLGPLAAFAAATGASPRPKVFCAARGYETFTATYQLRWRDHRGMPRELTITPERNARIRGPYPRRNVYGAALAYAPVLAADPEWGAPMLEAVLRAALTDDAPLLRELDIDPATVAPGSLHLVIEPRPGSTPDPELPFQIEIPEP